MKLTDFTIEELNNMKAECMKEVDKIPEKIGKLIEREKTLNQRVTIIDELLKIKEYE